ncbi:MAG TPA: YqgE/AlgH family protein [Casimicrobiaceae bacterium]|jgi:putative transcriptional regulator|nr:YqgE/AlgH family protein [Casimicrobiaceae bacterium]
MNRLLSNLRSFAALLAIAAVVSGTARAADLSEPVILVASSLLDPTSFQQAVILATPLDDGSHIGFIINKPIGVKLQELLPDDRAAGKVKESVYLGGPAFLPAVFALTRTPPASAGAAVRLLPDLFAVMDSDAIDGIIATTPNDARFFLGMMVWQPGALEEEVHQSVWELRPADAEVVLHAKSPGLWKSLRGPGPYI